MSRQSIQADKKTRTQSSHTYTTLQCAKSHPSPRRKGQRAPTNLVTKEHHPTQLHSYTCTITRPILTANVKLEICAWIPVASHAMQCNVQHDQPIYMYKSLSPKPGKQACNQQKSLKPPHAHQPPQPIQPTSIPTALDNPQTPLLLTLSNLEAPQTPTC